MCLQTAGHAAAAVAAAEIEACWGVAALQASSPHQLLAAVAAAANLGRLQVWVPALLQLDTQAAAAGLRDRGLSAWDRPWDARADGIQGPCAATAAGHMMHEASQRASLAAAGLLVATQSQDGQQAAGAGGFQGQDIATAAGSLVHETSRRANLTAAGLVVDSEVLAAAAAQVAGLVLRQMAAVPLVGHQSQGQAYQAKIPLLQCSPASSSSPVAQSRSRRDHSQVRTTTSGLCNSWICTCM